MQNEADVTMTIGEMHELLAVLKQLPSTPALRAVMEKVSVKLKRLEERNAMNILYGGKL